MAKILDLRVSPEIAAKEDKLNTYVSRLEGNRAINHIQILKRSIDARQKNIKINLRIEVFFEGEIASNPEYQLPNYPDVSKEEPVIIVGAGPAGLFAALKLIEQGQRPIVWHFPCRLTQQMECSILRLRAAAGSCSGCHLRPDARHTQNRRR